MRLPRSALALFAIAVAACAPPAIAARTDESELAPPSVVTVENQRTEDATIYLMRAGAKSRRLGIAPSLSMATFELQGADVLQGMSLQFLAKSFANGATDLSDQIPAVPGVRYRWQLGPPRGQSFLSTTRFAAADGTSTPAMRLYSGDRLPGNGLRGRR